MGATALASAVLALGLVLPLAQLLVWSFGPALGEWNARYLGFAGRSLLLAACAAAGIALIALGLAYAVRRSRGAPARLAARVATLGYALPGTVLAVGVFVPMVALSGLLARLVPTGEGAPAGGVLLQGTLLVMFVAYLVRFLAVGYSPFSTGL